MSIESRETVICGSDPRYSDAQRALWQPFDPKAGYDAIETFCGKDYSQILRSSTIPAGSVNLETGLKV